MTAVKICCIRIKVIKIVMTKLIIRSRKQQECIAKHKAVTGALSDN